MFRLKPLHNNVILESTPQLKEETSTGGLILPQERQYSTAKYEGKVLAIGPACKHVRVGQIALYAQYAVREEDDVLIIREDDILAVVNDV